MTIVIENSFWDLRIDKEYFSIKLSFDGIKNELIVPFKSLTAFSDPYANFHLKASQFLLIAAALVSSLQRKNWSRPLPQTKRSRGRKASFGKSGETLAAAGTISAALGRQMLDQSLGFS